MAFWRDLPCSFSDGLQPLHFIFGLAQRRVCVRFDFRVPYFFFPLIGGDFGVGDGDVSGGRVQTFASKSGQIIGEGLQFLFA